jgi:hypothetical protein
MSKAEILEILNAVSKTRLEMELATNPRDQHEAWQRLENLKTVATSEGMITEILCQIATNQRGLNRAS